MHAMIDVETMSLTPRAAVASIGAVAFDPWGEEPLNQRGRVLHVRLDLGAQAGREFDGLDYAIPYHRQLCARTVCFLSGVSRPRNLGIEHSAIDDALLQAEWLRIAIKALGVPRGK